MNILFESDISNDRVRLYFSNNKYFFKMVYIDDLTEHFKILKKAIEYLKLYKINIISLASKKKFIIPPNIYYNVYKVGTMNIIDTEISNFEKLYMENLLELITLDNIYINNKITDDDGWTKIPDTKQEKKTIMIKIKNEIKNFVGDWNNM